MISIDTKGSAAAKPDFEVTRTRGPLRRIDHRRGSANKYSWMPSFDRSVAYENERWWEEPGYCSVREPWFVQVMEDSVGVAHFQLVCADALEAIKHFAAWREDALHS
ncbi:hypothetical protein SKC41_31150 [Mycobacterium sp. 050128]|uniref:hypothetical protein n=1 Tax=Mycobacterium sp. 050128 TaxID=3096112 RepID=UPI002EDBA416